MEPQNWTDFNNLGGQPNIGDQLRAGRNQLLKIGGNALNKFQETTEALDQKYFPERKEWLDKGSKAWGNTVTNLTNNERVGRIAETTSRIAGEIFAPDSVDGMLAIGAATLGVMAPEPATSIAGATYLASKGRKIITRGSEYMDEFRRAFTGNTSGYSNPIYAVAGGGNVNVNKVDVSPITKLESTGNVTDVIQTTNKIAPKRDALNLYNRLVKDGYEIPESLQRKAKKIQNKDFTIDEGITVWTDKEAYRKAAQNAYNAGIPSADIRQNIGVFKDADGEIYQMMSRKKGPNLDMRSISEGANTDFNRKLALLQQQNKGTKAYNSAENVKTLMKRMNFQGTAKEFTAKYAIHHRRTIAAYEPFFSGLNSKDAAKLRELIGTVIDPKTNKGIKLGDDIDNLVAIPKSKHTLDKDSIHTLFREFGIEGSSKWPWLRKGQKYNAQDALREKFKKANVEQRFEAFKLYQEYVQQPGDEMLQKIIDAMT